MEDWLGVFTIVVVCGGVGLLLFPLIRLWREDKKSQGRKTEE